MNAVKTIFEYSGSLFKMSHGLVLNKIPSVYHLTAPDLTKGGYSLKKWKCFLLIQRLQEFLG